MWVGLAHARAAHSIAEARAAVGTCNHERLHAAACFMLSHTHLRLYHTTSVADGNI